MTAKAAMVVYRYHKIKFT